jgi:alpha-mannosidase
MSGVRSCSLLLALLFLASTSYAKEWKVYLVQEKHLDVGWSYLPADALDQGYPGSEEEFQTFALGRALWVQGYTTEFNYPADSRYRWFVDSAWQIEQAQKYQPQMIPKLRELINSGEFSYNPMYANLHTMMLGHEALMRTMSYAPVLEAQGFRRSYMANASDAFSVGWGYASMLASAGIKYFIKSTWYGGPSVTPGITNGMVEPAPLFRWVGADGKKVLFYYGGDYQDAGGNNGEALNEGKLRRELAVFEKLSNEGKWPYDAFPLFGSEGDFGIPDIDNSDFVRDWNKAHSDIHLIIAKPEEFFEYVEKNFGDKIPDGVPGGWGVSHDVEETTFAKPGARARANDHTLLAAEAFGAIAANRFGTPYDADQMRKAWLKQVLYHEHSFGYLATGPSVQSRRQYAWKNHLTEQVQEMANANLMPALHDLAEKIPSGGEQRVAVFNSLGFPHTGYVDLPIKNESFDVVDTDNGQVVPAQIWEGSKGKVLRFRASSVPAIGYKSFRIQPAVKAPVRSGVAADSKARRLENQFYRLTLAEDGSIASLFDKDLKAELFEASGAGPNPMLGNQFIFKDEAWKDHLTGALAIDVENEGALCSTLKAESAPMGRFRRITRRYTLCDGEKRLDISNSFTKEGGKSNSAETILYAFPFAVEDGAFHIDIPGVVARYPEDFRKETHWTYMPAQSFVSVDNKRMNIVLATREAPDFSFRTARPYFQHLPLPETPRTRVFAMPLTKQTVNRHDYDLDGGTYEFHYALTSGSGPLNPAAALRFAWGFQREFSVEPFTNAKGTLPPSMSFAGSTTDEVLVSTLKPANDGRGMVARLWNPGLEAASAHLSLAGFHVSKCIRTDLLERDTEVSCSIAQDTATIPVGAREFVTMRLLSDKPE